MLQNSPDPSLGTGSNGVCLLHSVLPDGSPQWGQVANSLAGLDGECFTRALNYTCNLPVPTGRIVGNECPVQGSLAASWRVWVCPTVCTCTWVQAWWGWGWVGLGPLCGAACDTY